MTRLPLLLLHTNGNCDQHGPYVSVHTNRNAARCPSCAEAQRAAEEAERQASALVARRQELLRDAGLRGRFRETTLETYQAKTPAQENVLACCQAFVRDFNVARGAGLWLLGKVGTGKTHLACGVVQACVTEHTITARVVTARGAIRRLRATWARDASETEVDVINELGRVDLLVLDEMGVAFGTEAELTQLFDVVDLRYQLRRSTVVLSNLNATLLREAIGERLFDRLREGAKTLVLDWPSHRAPAL